MRGQSLACELQRDQISLMSGTSGGAAGDVEGWAGSVRVRRVVVPSLDRGEAEGLQCTYRT